MCCPGVCDTLFLSVIHSLKQVLLVLQVVVSTCVVLESMLWYMQIWLLGEVGFISTSQQWSTLGGGT